MNVEPTRGQNMIAPHVSSREEAQGIASQFESLFVQQIVSKMREGANVMGGSAMFGSGPGSDTYASWFDTHMSDHLAKSGRVGVADSLMRHFEELGQIEPLDAATTKASADPWSARRENDASTLDRTV